MLETGLIAARFLQFAAAMLLLGAPAFYLYGDNAITTLRPWRERLLRDAAIAGVLATCLWLAVTATALAGSFDFTTLGLLLTQTSFGKIAGLRLALFVLSLLCLLRPARNPRLGWRRQTLIGAILAASLAWTGHGVEDGGAPGDLHLTADVAHLLAAGLWLGALPPLFILIVAAQREPEAGPIAAARFGLERFSSIGPGIVALLIVTGLINSWFLIGPSRLAALFTTVYGVALCLKLLLFALMLVLAANNRYRHCPALARQPDANALAALRRSVGRETALGAAVLALVASLGTLAPPQ